METAAEGYARIRAKAEVLAGDPDNLRQRAVVYHAVYEASGGCFSFPLVAAHGAVWAFWYLKCAQIAAYVFAVLDRSTGLSFRQKLDAYCTYVGTLKQINRKVMVEAYTHFYFARTHGPLVECDAPLSHAVVAGLHRFDQIVAAGGVVTEAQKRKLYEDFFRWEQDHAVGPTIEAALEAFDWPFMRSLCLRPWVWFSYFRTGRSLNFRNFIDKEERVAKGLAAYDVATARGWDRVARSLRHSPLLWGRFQAQPGAKRCKLLQPAE